MGIFDQLNYDINSKLPEWYKEQTGLAPIQSFSEKFILQILYDFLRYLGVEQPIQIWKSLPEEFNWVHQYQNGDEYLGSNKEYPGSFQSLKLGDGQKIVLKTPNTKRDCDAIIDIQLEPEGSKILPIERMRITNVDQEIILTDIKNNAHIIIDTKNKYVSIDDTIFGESTGYFEKIKSEPIDDPATVPESHMENKKTIITIDEVETPTIAKINIEVFDPVYVTEQNIKLSTISAFPLKEVRLFGYFCHKHNAKSSWKYLFNKTYSRQERHVYDRITKQYDCEIFYVEVEYWGVPGYITIGFPQDSSSVNTIFSPNSRLDEWGKYFGLPRRVFKNDISKDEEKNTYPPYYNYATEQDYWYERRLLNEYKYNDQARNGLFLKDTNGSNIAYLNVIDPYIEDIQVFTESIPGTFTDVLQTDSVCPIIATQYKEEGLDDGVKPIEVDHLENIKNSEKNFATLSLTAQNTEGKRNGSYMSNMLNLTYEIPDLPENARITGAELKIKSDIDSDVGNVVLNKFRCNMPFKLVGEDETYIWKQDSFGEATPATYWTNQVPTFTLGTKYSFFGFEDKEITPEEIKKGIDIENTLNFTLGLQNLSEKDDAFLRLNSIELIIYYMLDLEIIDTLMSVEEKDDYYNIKIDLTNVGDIPANLEMLLTLPNEAREIKDGGLIQHNSPIRIPYQLNIGESTQINIPIKFIENGAFDISLINTYNVIKEEIVVSNI